MFHVYLPKPLYEGLPWFYLGVAILLMMLPLSALKWIGVVPLALAGWITLRVRRIHRSSGARLQARSRSPGLQAAEDGRISIPAGE